MHDDPPRPAPPARAARARPRFIAFTWRLSVAAEPRRRRSQDADSLRETAESGVSVDSDDGMDAVFQGWEYPAPAAAMAPLNKASLLQQLR